MRHPTSSPSSSIHSQRVESTSHRLGETECSIHILLIAELTGKATQSKLAAGIVPGIECVLLKPTKKLFTHVQPVSTHLHAVSAVACTCQSAARKNKHCSLTSKLQQLLLSVHIISRQHDGNQDMVQQQAYCEMALLGQSASISGGSCRTQAPADVSRVTTEALSSTMRPPPTAPPDM